MNISVFGLGYVGSVTGAALADDGHHVIGVDVNPQKVACLQAGRSPIVEPGGDALNGRNAAAGRRAATARPGAAGGASRSARRWRRRTPTTSSSCAAPCCRARRTAR